MTDEEIEQPPEPPDDRAPEPVLPEPDDRLIYDVQEGEDGPPTQADDIWRS